MTMRDDLQRGALVAIVDAFSVAAHLDINRYLIDRVDSCELHVLDDGKLKSFLGGRAVHKEIYSCRGIKKISVLQRMRLFLSIIRQLRRSPYDRIIFLSYDVFTLWIINYLLKKRERKTNLKIACFEHNTFPFNWRRLIFQRLAPNVMRFVFTEKLKLRYELMGLSASYTPHFLIDRQPSPTGQRDPFWSYIRDRRSRYRWLCVCASGSVDFLVFKKIVNKYPEVLFILKSEDFIGSEDNVIVTKYFHDYAFAISEADFTFSCCKESWRVSGPAFDSLAVGTPVLTIKNDFGCYLKNKFGELVFFAGDSIPPKRTPELTSRNDYSINVISRFIACDRDN